MARARTVWKIEFVKRVGAGNEDIAAMKTLRLESPDEAKPRNSVVTSRESMPNPLTATHIEGTPPLIPTKEDDFISIETDAGQKRYLKTEVLQIASKQLQERTNICRSVEECWVYWKCRGRLDSKTASHWPLDAKDIDMEVMMPRRIKDGTTSSYANTSDQAALQPDPTAAMVPAMMPTAEASKLWPKEQKEFLCEVIKKKKNVQHRKSKEVFWQEVGEDMAEAGYKESYRMFRDYWDKHGRSEFQYDELPYFEREATPETIKQKNLSDEQDHPEIGMPLIKGRAMMMTMMMMDTLQKAP
ncbi:hypothetical protein EYC84_005458 [Monilinia fructicola]|uniref:Uncharacterized protein n=1 Tax=Monilinia fructicola TaxID=38448 RepID=A0A5M9JZH2_MONFR|nr:hypothetical protein EYC84_005458 [Monilinia fructicola]